jgi:hypothetical protein
MTPDRGNGRGRILGWQSNGDCGKGWASPELQRAHPVVCAFIRALDLVFDESTNSMLKRAPRPPTFRGYLHDRPGGMKLLDEIINLSAEDKDSISVILLDV